MARNLLTRATEQIGIDQRVWACLETGGYGIAATGGEFPVAADAIEHVNCKIDFNIPRDDAAHRSGRSKITRLSGKKDVKFSFETYITPSAPSGNDPTLPDMHPFLLSAFGAVDEATASKKTYSLARTGAYSVRMLEEGTHFSRLVAGCVVDTVTFSLPGDGKAMVKFEGFGQDAFFCGQSTLASAAVASNNLTLATGQGKRFEVGGYVDVIDKDDGNTAKASGREITAKTGDVLTVAGAVITADQDDIVVGAVPSAYTATASENALLGLKGSFVSTNFGTVDADLLSAEISLKNNYSPRANSYGKAYVTGFLSDKRREVTVKLEVLLTKDNVDFYTTNKVFTADGLTITLAPQDIPAPLNDADARTFTFRLPRVEFNISSLEQPADGPIKLTLEGTALSTSIDAQNAEMTLEIS